MEHGVNVRGGAPAQHHVLGDLPAHHRERLNLDPRFGTGGSASNGLRARRAGTLRRGPGRRRTRLDEAENVVLGDTAANSRSRNPRDVDVVFARDAPDERR